MSWTFLVIVAIVAILGGAISAVASAGIASVLVPLLALRVDAKVAVAITAVPHLVGGVLRTYQLRSHIDRRVVVRFGVVCAFASLAGALLHHFAGSAIVTYTFAALLVLAGVFALAGIAEHFHLHRPWTYLAGGVTGFCGGFAGEQGGLRALGMMGFDLEKEAFVATSTAIGVAIDAFRLPGYAIVDHGAFAKAPLAIAIMVVGVIAGTLVGARLLERVPERWFKRVLGIALIAMGALLLIKH
jgi:uncharacterized membrane protein YfcA